MPDSTMLPSKPRSGSLEFSPKKNPPLCVPKAVPASIYRKRNGLTSEIHPNSRNSPRPKPSKITKFSENPIPRASEMQQHMGQMDDELKEMKERLGSTEEERDRALAELGEIKKEVAEANSLKDLLSNAAQELKGKERDIESMKVEFNKAKEMDCQLAEKDAILDKLKEELSNFKASDACQSDLSSGSDKRIRELEADVDKWKHSETKLLDSFAAQTKQLEQTKISLEESKLEIASLQEKAKKSEGLSGPMSNDLRPSMKDLQPSMKEALESFRSELQLTKQILFQAKEGEKLALSKATSLLKEMDLLKHELKMATEAEENSKKAMDDLAMALKEVATEAKQVNEKLTSTQEELENIKSEAQNLKSKLKSAEDEYKTRLDEAKKEADRFRNTSERLRLEAEETLLAWNEKETGFVNCIKRVEEEKTSLIDENNRLLQALTGAENLTRKAKDENHKLRDILKQALNESNVAKEAAAIARAENSQLKDVLAEKDDALDFITRENESLRINEASALENIKDLKRMLAESSSPNASKADEKDKEQASKAKQQNSQDTELRDNKEHKDSKEHKGNKNKVGKTFSFNLRDLKIPTKHKEAIDDEHHKTQNKEKADEPKDEGGDEEKDNKNKVRKTFSFNLKDLKISTKHKEAVDDEHHKTQNKQKADEAKDEGGDEEKDNKNKVGKTFSFNLKDLKIPTKHKEAVDDEPHKTQNKQKAEEPEDEGGDEETPETDDIMKGSIFDVAETPVSKTEHHRKKSSTTFTFTVDGETISSEDLEQLEATHCDDENDKSSRKKRALLRRFGDILRKRSFH